MPDLNPAALSNLFDAATTLHRTRPTGETLTVLTIAGALLLSTPVEAPQTVPVAVPLLVPVSVPFQLPIDHEGDFTEIRATFDRPLSGDEALTAAACTGYALKKYFNAEPMGDPVLTLRVDGGRRFCEVLMPYDSSQRKRANPNVPEAFALAIEYITVGTPVRTTDRAGVGTTGTRLSEGIGAVTVKFEVR